MSDPDRLGSQNVQLPLVDPNVPGESTRGLENERRARIHALTTVERRLLRDCLLALSSGRAPTADELSRDSGTSLEDVRSRLRTLEARDFLALTGDTVGLVYPFTTENVPHRVVSSRGVAHSCCAIDALGVGAMLGESIEVLSECSHCGEAIHLRGKTHFEGTPANPVVFLPAMRASKEKAIECLCPSINFYCNAEHGKAHLGDAADHGQFASLDQATALGVAIFGDLLNTLEDESKVDAERTWTRVRERYAEAAQSTACCTSVYSPTELVRIPKESVLGLGSGNPVRHADLKEGEVVVDLGSGAGVDVFFAADKVGPRGRAIGVDMTPAMVRRARDVAMAHEIQNVEFHQSVIERLPVADGSVDVVLSNCVINLSPDKAAVFREAFRVLRPGGRLVVSDIVQERPLGVVDDDCGCVATAMVRTEYLATIRAAGFTDLEIVEDRSWLVGPAGRDASAITIRAVK